MLRAFLSKPIATHNHGPLLIGTGLAIVLAAQFLPAIPLATAIALIGIGATLTLERNHHGELLLALNFVIYAALVALAITAQMNLRDTPLTQCDAVIAVVLTIAATPRLARSDRAA